LDEAVASVGGAAQITRTRDAYWEVLGQLYALNDDSYIRANATGVIGSVNIAKGDTVTSATGKNSSSSGSSGSSGAGSMGNSLLSPLLNIDITDIAIAAESRLVSTQSEFDSSTSSDGTKKISARVYASASLQDAQRACTDQSETEKFLIDLAKAVCWPVADQTQRLDIDVDAAGFRLAKGVYIVTFSSKDDPTASLQTVVVLDDSTSSSGSTAAGGTGSSSTGSSGSSGGASTLTGSGSSGGSGSTGSSGSGASSSVAVSGVRAPAFTIESSTQMSVSITIDETDVATIKSGQDATVTCDALSGQAFDGKVAGISVSDNTYTATITIDKAEGMFPGFAATATIVKEQATDVVILPLTAVQQRGNSMFVYTTATSEGELGGEVEISTGISDEDYVEVTSGLAEGDTVYYLQVISTGAATSSTSSTGSTGGRGTGPGGAGTSTMLPNSSFSTGPQGGYQNGPNGGATRLQGTPPQG
jgi:multidrug efflux pump subunit AcrA (membrane-fusion protein)